MHSSPEIELGVASTVARGRIARPAGGADGVSFAGSDDARRISSAVTNASAGEWLGRAAGGQERRA